MIHCPKCDRVTESGEPTGTFNILEKTEEGLRIVSSQRVCMNCRGEKLKEVTYETVPEVRSSDVSDRLQ